MTQLSFRCADGHLQGPGPGASTGPQRQHDGDGEETDADHEVGHDRIRVELRIDDYRAENGLADDPAHEPGRQPFEVVARRRGA